MAAIVIVGAGFCGTVLAARLLRRPPVRPLQVHLINRSGPMGRGLAYGTRYPGHLLNVPAGRISAMPERPDDFLEFARRSRPGAAAGDFLPRSMYGQYLATLLADAEAAAPPDVKLHRRVDDVTGVTRDGAGGWRVDTTRESLHADKLVLALGHAAPSASVLPRHSASTAALEASPRYVSDPWAGPDSLNLPAGAPVLLLGTGLTMVDAARQLFDAGHHGGMMALSRRGLRPQSHREGRKHPPDYDHRIAMAMLRRPTARHYLATLRLAVSLAEHGTEDWRDVIGAIRSYTPSLWKAMPLVERARFLRHAQPYWDVHRHRCAPELWNMLLKGQREGRLRYQAGRLLDAELLDDGVRVTYRPRGQSRIRTQDFGYVVNCTGPECATTAGGTTLISRLVEAGHAAPDALRLGVRIDSRYRLQNEQGRASEDLYYVGPYLRAAEWEATAVPELSQHVRLLNIELRKSLGGDAASSVDVDMPALADDVSLP